MDATNVFMIPFAGGSKYAYRELVQQAAPGIAFIPLELPGRGARFNQELLTELDRQAEDILAQIRGGLDKPYALFGHSMGALLAYLITRLIVARGLPRPLLLFVCGCAGPAVKETETSRHLLPQAAFFEAIRKLGGSPPELSEDTGLLQFFEPVLRADFQAVETYVHREAPPFDIPVVVCYGKEEKITRQEALAWNLETRMPVEVYAFAGNHFFLFDHAAQLVTLLLNKLKALHYAGRTAVSQA
jgi:surfactin synthase thioesterase subunit